MLVAHGRMLGCWFLMEWGPKTAPEIKGHSNKKEVQSDGFGRKNLALS
jgi:hypothetical protein